MCTTHQGLNCCFYFFMIAMIVTDKKTLKWPQGTEDSLGCF